MPPALPRGTRSTSPCACRSRACRGSARRWRGAPSSALGRRPCLRGWRRRRRLWSQREGKSRGRGEVRPQTLSGTWKNGHDRSCTKVKKSRPAGPRGDPSGTGAGAAAVRPPPARRSSLRGGAGRARRGRGSGAAAARQPAVPRLGRRIQHCCRALPLLAVSHWGLDFVAPRAKQIRKLS